MWQGTVLCIVGLCNIPRLTRCQWYPLPRCDSQPCLQALPDAPAGEARPPPSLCYKAIYGQQSGRCRGAGPTGVFEGARNIFLSWSWLILCSVLLKIHRAKRLCFVHFCLYQLCLEQHKRGYKNRETTFQQLRGQKVWASGRILYRGQHFPTMQVYFSTFVTIAEE